MPQMSPLWWELLFMAFIIFYILMNIIIYFMFKNKMKNMNKMNNIIMQAIWKW